MTKRVLLLLAYLAFGAIYGLGAGISYPPDTGDDEAFGVWESITLHAFMWPMILALDLGYQSARNVAERLSLNEESWPPIEKPPDLGKHWSNHTR